MFKSLQSFSGHWARSPLLFLCHTSFISTYVLCNWNGLGLLCIYTWMAYVIAELLFLPSLLNSHIGSPRTDPHPSRTLGKLTSNSSASVFCFFPSHKIRALDKPRKLIKLYTLQIRVTPNSTLLPSTHMLWVNHLCHLIFCHVCRCSLWQTIFKAFPAPPWEQLHFLTLIGLRTGFVTCFSQRNVGRRLEPFLSRHF